MLKLSAFGTDHNFLIWLIVSLLDKSKIFILQERHKKIKKYSYGLCTVFFDWRNSLPAGANSESYQKISVPEVKHLLESGNALAVNVLSEIEFNIQHITGSINIPISKMELKGQRDRDFWAWHYLIPYFGFFLPFIEAVKALTFILHHFLNQYFQLQLCCFNSV